MQKTKNTKIFFTTIFLNKKRNFDVDAKNNRWFIKLKNRKKYEKRN